MKGLVMTPTPLVIIGLLLASAVGSRAEESRSDLFAQQPGRYQIIISPQVARNTFLLDTATGRVWQLGVYSDLKDDPTAWIIMPRIDDDSDLSRLVKEHGTKPKTDLPPMSLGSPAGNSKPPLQLR
jgi:hypothetical protein